MTSTASEMDRPATGVYELDPVHTFVLFSARHHLVGKVVGQFTRVQGTVTVTDDLAESSVRVSIDASSVDTHSDMRDDDLRGPDFFDVALFPHATFEGQGLHVVQDHWIVGGSLTVRGVSLPVALDVWFHGTVAESPPRLGFHASTALRRADYGMKRDLFTEIGSSTAPDVTIQIDTEATRT